MPINIKRDKGKKFTVEQTMKAQRGSRGKALTFDFGARWAQW
jgi:hypothetical protein